MTVVTAPHLGATTGQRRVDAVSLLSCYLLLLMAIPSFLVVGAVGAAGTPADLFAVVLLCWYLVARAHPDMSWGRGCQPMRAAAILFACAIVAAYISANRVAMPGLLENGADRGMIFLGGWLGVLLLAADGIDHTDRLATMIRRLVAGATAMAVLGIMEFCTRLDLTKNIMLPGLTQNKQETDLISRDGLVRVMATAAHPLELAAVLGIILPIAVHQARYAPPAQRLRRWLQVALIAGTMPLTVSRSAIFGLAVAAVVLIPTWHKRDRRRAYLALLAAPAFLWLAKPSLLSGFASLFSHLGTDTSTTSRTGAYSAAFPLIAQHPWLGQGFQTLFPQTAFFVDDQYLTSLIETGVIGTLALVALFVTSWLTARSMRRAAADAQTRDLAQCLAASVATAAVSFAMFDALDFGMISGVCFLVLGCLAAAWRLAHGPAGRSRPGEPPAAGTKARE